MPFLTKLGGSKLDAVGGAAERSCGFPAHLRASGEQLGLCRARALRRARRWPARGTPS